MPTKWTDVLRSEGFIKGSAAVREMFLGWRSLLLGCGGTILGFVGSITNDGIGVRLLLLAMGIVSLPLAILSWKPAMKGQ